MLGKYTIVLEEDDKEAFKLFGYGLEKFIMDRKKRVRYYRFDNIKSLDELRDVKGGQG